MKLSILILTTKRRAKYLKRLLDCLIKQLPEHTSGGLNNRITHMIYSDIEILIDRCEHCRIGDKRNELLKLASGEYLCFIDDDDLVSDDYIQVLRAGMATGADCLSLRGVMTTNGNNPEVFEHSIKYTAYKTTTNEIKYERYPNHLNCIKSSIAKQFKFPEWNWGEDTDYATQIFKSGLLKTEAYSDKVIYNYLYRNNK